MQRILLVEDNELSRDMLARRLARSGFAILVALDGQEAVEAVRREKPDLVLMDMSLPSLDGWSATRLLKSDPLTANIPVVALTAHAMIGDREKAIEAGCDEFATKPVDFPKLLSTIAKCLQVKLETCS